MLKNEKLKLGKSIYAKHFKMGVMGQCNVLHVSFNIGIWVNLFMSYLLILEYG